MKTLTLTVDKRTWIGTAIINQFTKFGLYTFPVRVGDDCASFVCCCFRTRAVVEAHQREVRGRLAAGIEDLEQAIAGVLNRSGQSYRIAEGMLQADQIGVDNKVDASTSAEPNTTKTDTAIPWAEWVESFDDANNGHGTVIINVGGGRAPNMKLADLIAEYEDIG